VKRMISRSWALALAVALASGCSQQHHLKAHNRGAELLASGDAEAAAAFFESALEAKPESEQSTCGLALALHGSGATADAIDRLVAFHRASPEAIGAAELLGHLLIEQGNLDEARDLLERVATPTPRILTQLALICARADLPNDAAGRLAEALQIDPAYAPAIYNLAVLRRATPDTIEEAETLFLRFRETAPNDYRASATIEEFLSGLMPDANADSLSPRADDTRIEAAYQALIDRAAAARELGDHDAADLLLRQAIKAYPDRPEALWLRAQQFYTVQGMPDEAARMFAQFKHLFPQDPRCSQIPAELNLPNMIPSTATAEEFLKEGLRHYNQQNYAAAISAYENALELSPSYATASYNLGLAYKSAKQLERAADAFRATTVTDSTKIKAWYMLGVTEMQRGRTAKALEALNTLLRDHPDYARAHYLLGILYDKEQHTEAARSHFTTYLEMEPSGEPADYVKQWLKSNEVSD
jgi:tetratricopeptide (TPR) repeat protein